MATTRKSHRCFVPACANNIRVNHDIKLFRFPENAERRLKWLSAISTFLPEVVPPADRSETQMYSTQFVCANHFFPSDFICKDIKRLNRVAVPSVFDSGEAENHLPERNEPLPLTSVVEQMTTLSPSSPHVLPVQHVYSRLRSVEGVNSVCNVSNAVKDNNTFMPVSSSTPKARCKLQMSDASSCSSSAENFSEILAVNLSDSTAHSTEKCMSNVVNRSGNLLKSMGVSKVSSLTLRKKKLFRKVQGTVKCLKRVRENLRKKKLTYKETIGTAKNLLANELSDMSPAAYNILMSQLRCKNRKPEGRRWTLDEKVMALTIYKRSPSCYSLLRRMLVLPSKRTLQSVLNEVPFKCGFDQGVMTILKQSLSRLAAEDKFCVLMLDEMSLKEHVQYCPREDKILGLVDNGASRSGEKANYVMVFMVRGLRKKWKQPVACYFTHGGMKAGELKDAMKEVLSSCFAIGLNVISTVCDMGSNNVAALKQLGAKFPDPFFTYDGHDIAVVFDPPHLLKCFRNMFLSHIVRGVKVRGNLPVHGAAKWGHLESMFEEDKKSVFRLAPKITDTHLLPTSSDRMRVSTAAQIMSHTVAATIHSFVSRDILPPDATVTASFLADVDQLFDSFNGSERYPPPGKPLRCCLSATSPHLEYWLEEAKSKVHNWQFCKDPAAEKRLKKKTTDNPPPLNPGKARKTVSRPPSQWGWITSINAVIHVWNVLSEAGFSYFQVRALNQDPLENLFGLIRSYCGANSNPTFMQFSSALKTAIVNGMAFKSFSGNCLSDDASILSDLRGFLLNKPQKDENISCNELKESVHYHDVTDRIEQAVESGDASIISSAYVAGFIAHRLLAKLDCASCKTVLIGSDVNLCNVAITFKEYSDVKNYLTYPSQNLVTFVAKFAVLFDQFMVSNSYVENLLHSLCQHMKNELSATWLQELQCDHFSQLQYEIVKAAAHICVRWWCKRVNRDLVRSRKVKQQAKKMKILTHK